MINKLCYCARMIQIWIIRGLSLIFSFFSLLSILTYLCMYFLSILLSLSFIPQLILHLLFFTMSILSLLSWMWYYLLPIIIRLKLASVIFPFSMKTMWLTFYVSCCMRYLPNGLPLLKQINCWWIRFKWSWMQHINSPFLFRVLFLFGSILLLIVIQYHLIIGSFFWNYDYS